MTAFDTSTNTPSASFSNAYGTVVFAPSSSTQYVYGFRRVQGKRYYEIYVDNAGGDPTALWFGWSGPAFTGDGGNLGGVFGGVNQQCGWYGTDFGTGVGAPGTTSASHSTAATGDTWMVSVDFGGGTDHAGNVVAVTTTDGSGNLILPVAAEIGQNGNWGLQYYLGFIYSAGGINGKRQPLVAREATSASAATVSLRVVTTSFAYAIPSGFVAWGDGPEGGTFPTISYSIRWDSDPARRNGNWTLSNSNYWGLHPLGGSVLNYLESTVLPTVGSGAGLRVIEFLVKKDPTMAGYVRFGLGDTTAPINSLTYSTSTNYTFEVGTMRSRNLTTTSLTNDNRSNIAGANITSPVQQYVVDHDNQRVWATNMQLNGSEVNWLGTNGAGRASPYKGATGNDGVTFTDSVGFRWFAGIQSTASISYVEINIGQEAFMAYPLMPGVASYNGYRRAHGQGDTWKPGLASLCYSHSNLGVGTNNPNITYITTSGGKFSGKKFFQVWHGQYSPNVGGMIVSTGLRPYSMTTLSTVALTKNNLVWDPTSTEKYASRYSVTSTGTLSGSWDSNREAFWESVAVDFDSGKIWFGVVDINTRTNVWRNGGNPSAGTGWDMTFTASTTLVAFTYLLTASPNPSKPTIFVAEDLNCIDIPTGFDTWNGGGGATSLTATPSGSSSPTASAAPRVLWPYGVQT